MHQVQFLSSNMVFQVEYIYADQKMVQLCGWECFSFPLYVYVCVYVCIYVSSV